MDETNLLDILDEAEIDLINRLRGYTEEGETIADGWAVSLSFKAGRWYVDQHHPGEAYSDRSVGDGTTFVEAWVSQCLPELRDGSLPTAAAEKPMARPRLRLIKGGVE